MKNHLFIGLGGQGGKSIAELRKVMVQRDADCQQLRENNAQGWDFLYIDSSRDVTNERKNWVHFGQELKLKPDSFLDLKDGNINLTPEEMAIRPDVAPWIGDTSIVAGFLKGAQGIQGANQRRRFGRLLFAQNAEGISIALDEKVKAMTEREGSSVQCAFHIFASLAGGTGSGTVVDLVTMLRSKHRDASVGNGLPIFLYLYVTSDDFAKSNVGYFHQNQYAALRDLNALACGDLHTTMLGPQHMGEDFSGTEAIAQIMLSTSLSEGNQRLSLAKQHQIVAEAAFERLHSYCGGNLIPASQQATTAEDRTPAFPGEPMHNPLRSFRFAVAGMRRWEVPIEDIKELLAADLYRSIYRQMQFQNWSDGAGYLNERVSDTVAGVVPMVDQLAALLDGVSVERQSLPGLNDQLTREFELVHLGAENEEFKDLDLAQYEGRLRDRYKNHLSEGGVEDVFIKYKNARASRVSELLELLHQGLQDAWMSAHTPMGMDYIPKVLAGIQERIKTKMEDFGKVEDLEMDGHLRQRMELRKGEWAKISFFRTLPKKIKLANSHRSDLKQLLLSDLRKRARAEDKELLDQLTGKLGTIQGRYMACGKKLKTWLKSEEKRREGLYQGLKNLQEDNNSNKSELTLADLDSYLLAHRTKKLSLQRISQQLRDLVIENIVSDGSMDAIGSMTDETEVRFKEAADTFVYDSVDTFHDELIESGEVNPILSSSILDILDAQFKADENQFEKTLKSFIDGAQCSARIDKGQIQPKVLMSEGNMPLMPNNILILGLPRNGAFSQKIDKMIRPMVGAGKNILFDIYHHDDDSQIRLLKINAWMGARFAAVVQDLSNRYLQATANDNAGDMRYFTNLDPDGQAGQRAPLLLPTPEESRSLMRSSKWLGMRMNVDQDGTKLLDVSEEGVSLMEKDQNGFLNPKKLSASLDGLDQLDVVQINNVIDAVYSISLQLNDEDRLKLKEEIKAEDSAVKNREGAGSNAYRSWGKERVEILNILS